MDLNKLKKIIPIIAFGTAFLWGQLGNAWDKSWIAIPVGGMAVGILHALTKDNGKDD